jgi:hypothetical protein
MEDDDMNYLIDGLVDRGGVETDRRAKKYSAENKVSYRDALSAVMREQRNYAPESVKPIDGLWPDPTTAIIPEGLATAYTSLANVAANSAVPSGHDAKEAARQINAIFDRNTIALAAQFVIERRMAHFVGNMSPGRTSANLQAAYRKVATELPNTWSLYSNGGFMTADACREMFSIKFFAKSGNDVRKFAK